VRYVVVVGALAPEISGVQSPPALPPPPGLLAALSAQSDLAELSSSAGGLSVFENTAALPERAERSGEVTATAGRPASWPTPGDLEGWHPVLAGAPGAGSYAGTVTPGTVFASYAPAGRWRLSVDGFTVASTPAFGWASQYTNVPSGRATLDLDLPPFVPLGAAAELALWLVVAGALLGRRRWLWWWWRPLAARRRARAARRGAPTPPADDAAVDGDPVTAGDAP
jgi:hypothetical protein